MRDNGSLTGLEVELRDEQILVSRTDAASLILYANADFVEISGYSEAELLGQPQNILRHPEMPAEVFADLWHDLKAGRPWIGLIKNRCKNGDAYWVEAHVSPIWEKGAIAGYLSLRRKPSRAQIDLAKATYAAMREARPAGFVFRHGSAKATGTWTSLRSAFADAPVAVKFISSSLVAALVVLACFAYFLASSVSRVLDDDARERLGHDVGLVVAAVAARVDAARGKVIEQAGTFSEVVYAQMGGKKKASRVAIARLEQVAISARNRPIDAFLRDLKGVATVFELTPAGFQRRLTTLRNESGDLALGTVLDKDHPGLAALLAGKPYVGSARLFGRRYLTSYVPLMNADDQVVGATFVGLDLTEQLEFLKAEIRHLKVGRTGYYYVIDVSPGPDFGRLVLHPYKEGQHLPPVALKNDRDLLDEMVRLKQGSLVYPWMNQEAGETQAREKLVMFQTLADPEWIIAGGSALDDFTELSKHITWYVVVGGLAMAAAIFFIVLWLLRRLILNPLNQQVLPAFQAMSAGGFETRLDVRGADEIAQVIQGLESLQNRLAYDAEQSRGLSALREAARQEAESLSRARAGFLANMSHEIRTPMNAIIGLAYLLLQSELGRRERDYVRRIESAGKLLLALVNDILDFSKIDAGRLHLEEAAFRLDDVLENLSAVLRERAQDKNLILEYVVAPGVPQNLLGDALRLSQILINLAGNAIKFTSLGSVIVFVDAEQEDAGQLRLDFRIQDTGIGMSAEQLGQLFQPFSQADSSITRRFGGTGLGLAICKRLVELMGGTLWVDSQPQSGSVFSFNVRLRIDHAAPAPARQSGYRVLVVDDNDLARTVVARLLQKNGCTVRTSNSGDAALALLQEPGITPFDCIMLDLNMPGMDGLMLARQIRAGQGATPKLVLVTAVNIRGDEYRGAFGDFDVVLEKPVTSAQIHEVLAQLGEAASSRSQVARTPAAQTLAGLRIMVVEDVPTNQLIMRDLLESFGARIDIADNGIHALQLLAEHSENIDLILMDIQMPEMDGLEAARRIRGGRVRADIPIIALTANALDEERQRAIAAGMNDFLTKPIEPAQLNAVLQRWRPRARPPVPLAQVPEPPGATSPIPELPGIDTAVGLRHMGNRTALYEKILRDFNARFLGETERIRAALACQQKEDAARRAHSLKGLGATIGAAALAALASELQQAIQSDSPDLDEHLAGFDRELTRVLAGIQSRFAAAAGSTATPL